MTRSRRFHAGHAPFDDHPTLEPVASETRGPWQGANPTRAQFRFRFPAGKDARPVEQQEGEAALPSQPVVRFLWRSRNNRKGRHEIDVRRTHPSQSLPPIESTAAPRSVLRGIWRMFSRAPLYDLSYQVAILFTIGSVIWCINGFFSFLPLVRPDSEFPGEATGGGVTAFIGATIFEIGSVFLIWEAINANKDGCFGWVVQETWNEALGAFERQIRHSKEECTHHHQAMGRNLRQIQAGLVGGGRGPQSLGSERSLEKLHWIWWPSWHELTHHYFREIGFLASFSQLIGATIFWIAGFTALPGILNNLSPGLKAGVFWTPQVMGGCGFVISGTLFMLETQKKWWKPAFGVLGWHIGFWNLIGGIGFTICPAFGYSSASWAQYQSSCSTFWGSWAFLIGSVIQWYESLEKYPARVKDDTASA